VPALNGLHWWMFVLYTYHVPNMLLHVPGALAKCKMQNASCSAHGRMGFAAPRVSLLSFTCICYTTNMSGNQVLQGACNVVIRGGTFTAADIAHDALMSFIPC